MAALRVVEQADLLALNLVLGILDRVRLGEGAQEHALEHRLQLIHELQAVNSPGDGHVRERAQQAVVLLLAPVLVLEVLSLSNLAALAHDHGHPLRERLAGWCEVEGDRLRARRPQDVGHLGPVP